MKKNLNPDFDRLKDWSKEFLPGRTVPTVQMLVDAGFCRITASKDVKDCISRLDSKGWLESLRVNYPGSEGWDLPHQAHMSRTRFAKGYRNVPKELLDQLPWSDDDAAPVEFRYHWRYPQRMRTGAEQEPTPPAPPPMEEAPPPAPSLPDEKVKLDDGSVVEVPHEAFEHPLEALANAMATQQPDEDEEMNMPVAETAPVELEPIQMKVVVVKFHDTGEQEYHYFAPVSAAPGDWAVVYSRNGKDSDNPFSIGKIDRDSPDLEGRARSAILGVFNEDFASRVQARMDKLAQVKASLQRKRQQYEERRIYELIAKDDPETASLLSLLKQLEG